MPAPQHLFPKDVENLINKNDTKDDSGDGETSEDEENAQDSSESRQRLSSRLSHNNSQPCNDAIDMQTVTSNNSIPPIVTTFTSKYPRSAANITAALEKPYG